MPYKTHYIDLPEGDDLMITATGEADLRRRATPDPRAQMRVSNYEGPPKPLQPPGTPPPPVEPPPDPEPGEVVFSEGFETFPGLWDAEKGLFTQGNTKTHGIPPTPAMGAHSLRMKLAIGAPDPGKFPPGESDSIRLAILIPPGLYRLTAWGVAHDTGKPALEVVEAGKVVGGMYGTEGLNELEWKPRSFDFETLTGDVTLVQSYEAPASIDAESGHKIALITIEALG